MSKRKDRTGVGDLFRGSQVCSRRTGITRSRGYILGNEKLILRVRLLVLVGAAVLLMVGCSSDSGSTTQGKASATFMPWQFWDPADPEAPVLFEKSDAGYKLKAGWS